MGETSVGWIAVNWFALPQPEDELLEPVDDELPLELDEEPPAA